MLIQVHHQHRNGKVDFTDSFCIQRDVQGYDETQDLVKEAEKTHPLPDGMMWMFCTEESEYFIKTRA